MGLDADVADEVGEADAAGVAGAGVAAALEGVVKRLLEVCGGMGAAAAAGSPGKFVLPQEVLRQAERRVPERRASLPRPTRLADLQAAFELTDLEVDLVVIAAAVDLDERVAVLTGYAHDDLTRQRLSVGLAATLCGVGLDEAELHTVLSHAGRLARSGLIIVEAPLAPFPSRPLRCPERVLRCLVGIDEADPPIAGLLVHPPPLPGAESERIVGALNAGVVFHYIEAAPSSDPRGIAVGAGATLRAGTLVLELDRLVGSHDVESILVAGLREARLRRSILVAGPVERLVDAGEALEAWAASGWPTILHGSRSWDPAWARTSPLLTTAPMLRGDTQAALWAQLLGDQAPAAADLAQVTASFRLTGEQVRLAASAALTEATAEGRSVEAEDLRHSARRRNTGSLERLARRVRPEAGWDDLVLPTPTLGKLQELVERARHRELVYNTWGLGGAGQHTGNGLTALFAGSSGTGKTLAAEVIANALGLDLYLVDLSTVVDKFIGETEKNLERIFDEAERVNGVLVFDEADALFSKRSEVSDAHDRYANLETAYLLQRMEAFGGTAILTTNLRSNLDDAFARRLGAVVAFPLPDPESRLALWRRFLGGKVPVADDVDLEFCAQQFDFTGANIRNVAIAAAFFAAEGGPPVQMEDVVRAVEREFEKLGRLRGEDAFGRYAYLLRDLPGTV